MAVKKSKSEVAAPKASAKPVAGPKPVLKSKAATPAVASDTASKAATPKAAPVAAAKSPAPKAGAKKAAVAAVKLTDRQLDFLKQIHGTKDSGYLLGKKAEQKTLDALINRKLIKKGAKDKLSGNYRYTVSKAGEKHLSALPPA